MKNVVNLLLLAVVLASSLTALFSVAKSSEKAPATGVQFFTGTWKELLAEAKKQNKPIFVDVYTTWCGPCHEMAKQAFPDKVVGDLINSHFISYKLDAEKGEGIALARQYAVTSYPTLMYLDANGKFIHRHMGYGNINDFWGDVNTAILATLETRPIAVWDAEFDQGKRDVYFLATYLRKRADFELPNAKALAVYLTQIPEADWTNEDNLLPIVGNLTTANSKVFDLILLKVDSVSRDRESGLRNSRVLSGLLKAVSTDRQAAKTESEFEQSIQNARRISARLSHGPRPDEWWRTDMETNQRIEFYQRMKNSAKHRELATKRANKLLTMSAEAMMAMNAVNYQRFQMATRNYPDSVKNKPSFKRSEALSHSGELDQRASKLNGLAWSYVNYMTDPADLNQALDWSARSLISERLPQFLDTYAQLLGKLGRKAEAIKYEEEALAKAKANGEDTADYAKTLASFMR